MMPDLQDELNERFETLAQTKDPEQYFFNLAEYIRFVQDVPSLTLIARRAFAGGRLPIIGNLYKTLQRAWLEDDSPVKTMWGDVNRHVLGKTVKYELPGITLDMRLPRAQVRIFHAELLNGFTHTLLKEKIVIIIRKKEQAICSAGDATKCYVIKGEKRFKIVLALLSAKSASARQLAKTVGNKETRASQENMKNEIGKINELFQYNLHTEYDLIISRLYRGKNIYALNEKIFSFRTEK